MSAGGAWGFCVISPRKHPQQCEGYFLAAMSLATPIAELNRLRELPSSPRYGLL